MSITRISKTQTNVRNGGTPVIIRDAMFIADLNKEGVRAE